LSVIEIFMAASFAWVTDERPIEDAVEIVLFDLGGVLLEVAGVARMRALSGIETDEELWARWLGCRWVRQLEAGQCSADEFAAGVVADWELPVAPADFLATFGAWVNQPFPGATELVAETGGAARVGCLSNTNAFQWEAHFGALPFIGALEFRFLSFELGLVKPDPAIFEAVAAGLPASPERVLFLDDNLVNVKAAAASGFVARHVRGVGEARQALVETGVLAG
jgi:FMN phosphatase YigB (HAD superfamily)